MQNMLIDALRDVLDATPTDDRPPLTRYWRCHAVVLLELIGPPVARASRRGDNVGAAVALAADLSLQCGPSQRDAARPLDDTESSFAGGPVLPWHQYRELARGHSDAGRRGSMTTKCEPVRTGHRSRPSRTTLRRRGGRGRVRRVPTTTARRRKRRRRKRRRRRSRAAARRRSSRSRLEATSRGSRPPDTAAPCRAARRPRARRTPYVEARPAARRRRARWSPSASCRARARRASRRAAAVPM